MNKSNVLLLTAMFLGFSASAALADEGKIYVGLDVGRLSVPSACNGLPSTVTCSSSTTAYQIDVGYQVNQYVAGEFAFLKTGDLNASGTYNGTPVTGTISSSAGFNVSAVGSYPIAPQLEVLGKLGFVSLTANASASGGGLSASSSQGNTNLFFGVGVRYLLTKQFAVRAMYQNFGTMNYQSSGSGSSVSMLSIGAQYAF